MMRNVRQDDEKTASIVKKLAIAHASAALNNHFLPTFPLAAAFLGGVTGRPALRPP